MKTMFNYAYRECEDGVWHAFAFEDKNHPIDADSMAQLLAKQLFTTPDDPRFNWDQMEVDVPIPTCDSDLNPDAVGKLVVRLIGTEKTARFVVNSQEGAADLLRKEYEAVLNNHNDIFDEKRIAEGDNSLITGEEFYQSGEVYPENPYIGVRGKIYQIREYANDAATFANCFEYELLDMSDVYKYTSKIEALCAELFDDLKPKDESYQDLFDAIRKKVEKDDSLPDSVKQRAKNQLQRMEETIVDYPFE
jgi:hypothetical protein